MIPRLPPQLIRIVLAAMIPLALFEAWWVSPSRDYWKEMDFAVFYTAGRMFTQGTNPYVRASAEHAWQSAGGDEDVMDVIWGPFAGDENDPADRADHWLPVEVVPPGLTVMTPFSLLPVGLAWPAWNYVVALLFVGQLYATTRLMRRPLWDGASLAAISFTVLLEPLHIGLANGQPTVPTISLLVLALHWATSGRQDWAGVAFAIATALKPPLAAPFVLLFAFQGKWRTVAVAAIVGIALTLIAVGPMTARHPEWVHTWAGQVDAAEGSGNIDSARTDNPGRNDLLNLALIGHLATNNATVVNTTAIAVWAAGVAGLFCACRKRRESLGTTAAFAVLALLPMYHRYYDAGILTLAVGWALVSLRPPTRWLAIAVLAVAAIYCVSEDWVDHLFRSANATDRIARSWWFNGFAQPHHAWELLAILACVGAGLWWGRARPEPMRANNPTLNTWWSRHRTRIAVALLIPPAVMYGWWITPDRDTYKELDFAMYYTASRTFLHGQNPYSRLHSYDTWTDAEGDYDVMECVLGPNPWDEAHVEDYWLPVNCIPPALAALAPFAALKVPVAWPMWNVVIGLLLAFEIWAVTRLMKVPLWSAAALWVMVALALIEPTHIGLANGQPSVPAVALTAIACWLAVINWQISAGIAIALATALKPQLGGPFVLLLLWQRGLKAVTAAAIVGTALTLVTILPMTLHTPAGHHFDWLKGWVNEVKYAERPGGVNDARRTNTCRNDMVHLQVLVHFFSDSPAIVNALTEIVIVGLGYLLYRLGRGRETDFTVVAAFSVLPLLFAYHRLYDCGILLVPVGWAIVNCRRGATCWPARCVLMLAAVYAISQGQIDDAIFGGADRPPIGKGWWFDLFVEPHHQWGLLGIFGCLMLALRWERHPTAESGDTLTPPIGSLATV